MRGSRKSQALALIALAAIPPPAHGSDFASAWFWLGRGAVVFAACLLTLWWLRQRKA